MSVDLFIDNCCFICQLGIEIACLIQSRSSTGSNRNMVSINLAEIIWLESFLDRFLIKILFLDRYFICFHLQFSLLLLLLQCNNLSLYNSVQSSSPIPCTALVSILRISCISLIKVICNAVSMLFHLTCRVISWSIDLPCITLWCFSLMFQFAIRPFCRRKSRWRAS